MQVHISYTTNLTSPWLAPPGSPPRCSPSTITLRPRRSSAHAPRHYTAAVCHLSHLNSHNLGLAGFRNSCGSMKQCASGLLQRDMCCDLVRPLWRLGPASGLLFTKQRASVRGCSSALASDLASNQHTNEVLQRIYVACSRFICVPRSRLQCFLYRRDASAEQRVTNRCGI
jgi:hypothetical protein